MREVHAFGSRLGMAHGLAHRFLFCACTGSVRDGSSVDVSGWNGIALQRSSIGFPSPPIVTCPLWDVRFAKIGQPRLFNVLRFRRWGKFSGRAAVLKRGVRSE